MLIGGLTIANGTVTDIVGAHQLSATSALISHVIGVALRVAPSCSKSNAAKRLVDSLRNLTAADPSLKVEQNAAGELVLLGAGELHLEVSVARLERESQLKLVKSEPVVTMRETLVGASARTFLGKSSNKHNRLFVVSLFLSSYFFTLFFCTLKCSLFVVTFFLFSYFFTIFFLYLNAFSCLYLLM